MKYLIQSFLLTILISQSVLSQTREWQRVQLDENVSIEFPESYEQIDTLYQKITVFRNNETTFTASIFQANKYQHTDKKLLEEGYSEFIIGAYETLPKSNIIEKNISIIDNLLCGEFVVEFMNQGIPIIQNMIVVFIRERTYSFSIMSLKNIDRSKHNAFFKRFKESIDFNNLSLDDQI